MPINLTYASGNAVTIGATETSLAVNGGSTILQTLTDVGMYEIVIDASNLAKGDEYAFKLYEKAEASASKRVLFQTPLSDAQSELFTIPGRMLGLGFDYTLKKNAGTDRAFSWTLRRIS